MSDDLDQLLAELQRPQEPIIPAEPVQPAAIAEEPEFKLAKMEQPATSAEPEIIQTIQTPKPIQPTTVLEPPLDPHIELLQKLLGSFEGSSKEVFEFIISDRKALGEFIDDLRQRIDQDGGDPPRILFEAMAQALETRANTSLAAVRWLDSRTKLVQALRGGITINNNNKGGDQELQQILASPAMSDFDE